MNNTGFGILLLLALSTPSQGATREYHYVQLEKTWTEAQSYCRENFADLATIQTEEDWKIVQKLVENASTSVWIGLYDDLNGWKWSLDNTYLYKDGITEIGQWFEFRADNYKGIELCVVIAGGILNDYPCDVLKKSVCYDEPTNTYIPVTVLMNWSSAQRYCREKYTDLTSMRSLQEKEAIIKVGGQSDWWIGLYRDSWKWSDQSHLTLTAWNNGEPNGHGKEPCGSTEVTGWIDLSCDNKKQFICSGPVLVPTTTMVLKVVLKAEGSMNDAQLEEAVLKNLEKQVKDHCVHQECRVKWRKQPSGKIFQKIEV